MPLVSRTFDQLIDFTRTSSATFVGSNGLIQSTPESRNLLTFTQEFDNGAWSKNGTTALPFNPATATYGSELVTNGDFSAGATGWTLGSDWTVSGGAAQRGANPTASNLEGGAGVEAGKTYRVTWTQSADFVAVYLGTLAGPLVLNSGTAGTYTLFVTATVAGGIIFRASSTVASIDNVSVKEVIGGLITAPDGTSTADKLVETATTGVHNAGRTITTTAVPYTWSCYVKAAERTFALLYHTQTNASVSIDLSTGATGTASGTVAPTASSVTSVGNGWFRVSMTVTATAASNFFGVYAATSLSGSASYTGDGTSGIYVWGAQLELGSTASDYTRNYGGLFPPRFDYDPVTLAPRGLLIEEQRTNLQTRSEDFDSVSWVKSGITITSDATASPAGALTADKIVEDSTTGLHRLLASYTLTLAAHTMSVYAKAAERSWVMFGNGSDGQRVYFDVLNGVVGTATGGATGAITAAGGGWYRCSVTFTPTATSRTLDILLALSNNTNSYTGDGTSGIYLWGAQLEAGAFATSYIPAVASQVTRTADVALIQAPNFAPWFNATQGTLFVEATTSARVSAVAVLENVVSFSNTLAIVRGASSQALGWFIGSAVFQSFGITSANFTFKSAGAYKAGDNAAVINGGAPVTDAGSTYGTLNALGIGCNTAGGQPFNGHIRSIRYYPVRLSDAQLQALTA